MKLEGEGVLIPEVQSDTSAYKTTHTHKQTNRQRVVLGDSRSWLKSLLAVSVIVNLLALYEIRDHGTLKWLHDWDLNQFENGPYVETKIKVGEIDARLRAVENSQACKR